MCIVLLVLGLILVFYGSERLANAQLVDLSGSEPLVLAQGWQILEVLWPFLATATLVGVFLVLMALKLTPKK
jgi:uncharacterized membrane protein YphA (DoxX/SURF4 family)